MATGASIASCISRLHYGLSHFDARGAEDVLQGSPEEDTNSDFLMTQLEVELRDLARLQSKQQGTTPKSSSGIRGKAPVAREPTGTLREGVATLNMTSSALAPRVQGAALTFAFERPTAAAAPASTSALTQLIPLGSAPEMSSPAASADMKAAAASRGGQDMKVFFTMYHKVLRGKRLEPKGPNLLKLRAAKNVEVGRFIEFAMERYNLELDRLQVPADDKTRAVTSPAAWIVKMAEDNGEPDEDVQIDVALADPLEKYGISQITLIPNPMYKPDHSAAAARADLKKSGTAAVPAGPAGPRVNRVGSLIGGQRAPAPVGGSAATGDGVVRVNLPTLAGGQYVVVPYTTDMLIEALIDQVCRKRQMGASFAYELRDGKDRVVSSAGGKKVGDLPPEVLQELKLCTKQVTATEKVEMKPVVAETGPMNIGGRLFFTEATASAYVEYRVIKMNKHGKKQERVMGIDRDRISNKNDNKAKRGLFNRAKVKNPERPMTEVASVELEREGEPGSFSITYKTEGKYKFEAQNPEVAAEIVARIRFLVDLANGRS